MPQTRLFKKSLPPEMADMISRLGERIRIARKRRGITMEEMASRMFVNRKTLSRLEKGDSGISIAVFVSALWVLGLDKDIKNVALPELDQVGILHERKRLPVRVRASKSAGDLDF